MVGHLLYASKRMSFILQPLQVFVAVLIEYVRDQQELVIDYLQLDPGRFLTRRTVESYNSGY